MRCKKHTTDLSSAAGVCATCLRHRLTAVAAAQIQLNQTQQQQHSLSSSASVKLPFHPELYSTPQLAKKNSTKGNKGNFSSLIQGIFGSSKSEKGKNNSFSISTLIPNFRKKNVRYSSRDIRENRRNRSWNRGMSPARFSDDGGMSGCSSESSRAWEQTPRRTPAIRRGNGHTRSLSGLVFCLSPMVSQQRIPQENCAAAEARVPANATTSFCKNRSRKLADFGRHYYSTNY